MSRDRQPGAEARLRIANLLHGYTDIADRKDVDAAVALLGSARVTFPMGGFDRPGRGYVLGPGLLKFGMNAHLRLLAANRARLASLAREEHDIGICAVATGMSGPTGAFRRSRWSCRPAGSGRRPPSRSKACDWSTR